MIRDHVWRPRTVSTRRLGPKSGRPCEYMNCGRPRTEHERAVVAPTTNWSAKAGRS